jgi:hypothetical protein
MAQAFTNTDDRKRLLSYPASSGKLTHQPCTLSTNVKLPDVCSQVVIMGLLEQNTLGNIQGAGKAQLQELFI